MPDQNSSHSPHQERLNRIVADYLDAAKAGPAPDRREILARHPDLADELATFFAELEPEPIRQFLKQIVGIGTRFAGSHCVHRAAIW